MNNEAGKTLLDWYFYVEDCLQAALPPEGGPVSPLPEAMRHAVLSGGKRLRPLLVLAACQACGGKKEDALPAALAIELIHTYSLIHDDLPAMDDDDLRRGRPTVHVAFDEATAILAGDALQTLAFEILSRAELPPERIVHQVRTLAVASGVQGMCGGQQLDLLAEGQPATEELVIQIDHRKTGALLAAAFRLGAEAAGVSEVELQRWETIGRNVGMAFQIQDDLLDETATTEELGKTAGKDKTAGKVTWPAAVGREEAQRRADGLLTRALTELETLGEPAAPLVEIVQRVMGRKA